MDIDLNDLRTRSTADLIEIAERFRIERTPGSTRQDLLYGIMSHPQAKASITRGSGTLEILPDGFGFLRTPEAGYLVGVDDIYVSPSQIRRFNLRTGDTLRGQVRAPKDNERYFALIKVEHVNGLEPEHTRPVFEHLVAIHPERHLRLEHDPRELTTRAIDLIAPLGLGQRCLLLAHPRSGHQDLLMGVLTALRQQHPTCRALLLLLQQRPEDVTEYQRLCAPGPGSERVELVATLLDEPAARHVQVADIVMERARRLAEYGQDVVLIVDSITTLTRASNEAFNGTPTRVLAGGIEAAALQRSRRLLASARALAGQGSVTVIASVMVGTESRTDEAIADFLKGPENSEIHLLPAPIQGAVLPVPGLSMTRHMERFLPSRDLERLALFRSTLPVDAEASVWALRQLLEAHPTNAELLDKQAGTGE